MPSPTTVPPIIKAMDVEELALHTSLELTSMLLPWIAILISIIIALLVKDWAMAFIKGLRFKMRQEFNPGDMVMVDNEPAVIVSIGVFQTVFAKETTSGDAVWRYVPNERLAFLKLEKVVRPGIIHKDLIKKMKVN